MSSKPRPRQAHLTLPELSGAEATLLVAFLERAVTAVWHAHGDVMIDFLRTNPAFHIRTQPILHSPARIPRRRREPWSPVPMPDEAEIYAHPELAPLAVLEAALCAAINSLKAGHPDLCNADQPDWTPSSKTVDSACSIIHATARLFAALHRYRAQIDAFSEPSEQELPF